jgi:hypothetical protein
MFKNHLEAWDEVHPHRVFSEELNFKFGAVAVRKPGKVHFEKQETIYIIETPVVFNNDF